jgi:hypothetical protein
MTEPTETVVPIYGGGTSIDYRAEANRQAEDYRSSQRCADWEMIAKSKGKKGNPAVLAIWLGLVVLSWTLIILGISWALP